VSSHLIGSLATTEELAEVFSDRSVLKAMLSFEVALARAQTRLGMIPAAVVDAIEQAASVEHFDAAAIARSARESASIAIPFVKALMAQAGDASRYVHWGATSQDVVDTTMVLLLKQAEVILQRQHTWLLQSLRELSGQHAGTVMLARTLLQPAPPITFGYKVACWYAAIYRSWPFVRGVPLQFGGASGTLAAYGKDGPAVARELARELGLALPGAPWHTQRDRFALLVSRCGIYTECLGKIARDIALLMQQEVAEVAEAGGGSSTMPNKQNPSGCTIVLAAATRMPGLVAAYLSGMIQEHERSAGGWQAEWATVSAAIQTTGSALAAIIGVIEGLSVDADRMRANLAATHGVIFAEKAAILLTPTFGRDAARTMAADAAREAAAQGRPMREILAGSGGLTEEQLADLDNPYDYLGAAEEFRRKLLEEDNAAG